MRKDKFVNKAHNQHACPLLFSSLGHIRRPQRKGRKMEHEHHNNKDLEDMKRKKLFHFTKCRPMFKIACALLALHTKTSFRNQDQGRSWFGEGKKDHHAIHERRICIQRLRKRKVKLYLVQNNGEPARHERLEAKYGSSAIQAAREEVDSRSVYVGNVDYSCTAEIVRQHFQECGVVNRVTILTNSSGHPKGCAYVEFMEIDSVNNALLLNESVLHGRILKVCAKRTNIPGVGQFGRRPFGSRAPFNPTPGYGRFRRFSRPTRYRPY